MVTSSVSDPWEADLTIGDGQSSKDTVTIVFDPTGSCGLPECSAIYLTQALRVRSITGTDTSCVPEGSINYANETQFDKQKRQDVVTPACWTIDAFPDEFNPYMNGNRDRNDFGQVGRSGPNPAPSTAFDIPHINVPAGADRLVMDFEVNAFCGSGKGSGLFLGKTFWTYEHLARRNIWRHHSNSRDVARPRATNGRVSRCIQAIQQRARFSSPQAKARERWDAMRTMNVARRLVVVTALLGALHQCASAEALSSYLLFENLTPAQQQTLQGKLTPIGENTRIRRTLAFAVAGHSVDLAVFRPFYRAQFSNEYSSDFVTPTKFDISSQKFAVLIDSLAAYSGIADGGADSGGGLAFALSCVVEDTVRAFESVLDTTNSRFLVAAMLNVFASDDSARQAVEAFACGSRLLPGGPPADVTSQVSVRLRGFRKVRATGQYVGKVRVTNTSGQALAAPVILVFRPVDNITPLTRDGVTCTIFPAGASFLTLPAPKGLGPGAHVDVTLRFENPDQDRIELFHQRVLSGPGFH